MFENMWVSQKIKKRIFNFPYKSISNYFTPCAGDSFVPRAVFEQLWYQAIRQCQTPYILAWTVSPCFFLKKKDPLS